MSETESSAIAAESPLLQQIRDDALSLEAAYPDYFAMGGLDEGNLVSLASQRLVARGLREAGNLEWVRQRVDLVTLRVLAKECLFHRLVELLDRRGDIGSAIHYARKRGCDEHDALDAVEDAIVSLVQRGHGLKAEDTLIRFFRIILWEKMNEVFERKEKRAKFEQEYAEQLPKPTGRTSGTPLDVITSAEARELLMSSLEGMNISVERRASLFLKYGAGWTSEEIAGVLRMTAGQVDTMNHRTRRNIRSRLKKSGDMFTGISAVSADRAARTQEFARKLSEKREQAAVVLHTIFSLPANDVVGLCGISEIRLSELAGLVRSDEDFYA